MNMTSNSDVSNNVPQIQMATTCHWMNPPWKFSYLRHCAPLGFNRLLQGFATCGSRIFDNSHPGIIEIVYVSQVEPFHLNVGSSWAATDIISSSPLSLCVRDCYDTEVSTYSLPRCALVFFNLFEAVTDLPVAYVGLRLGSQDRKGPPANCGTHRFNFRYCVWSVR